MLVLHLLVQAKLSAGANREAARQTGIVGPMTGATWLTRRP
jgi:hypothetical protein